MNTPTARSVFILALAASAAPALASDSHMVRNLARHTGLTGEEVTSVLGERRAAIECQYYAHPARRSEIARTVLAARDAQLAAAAKPGPDGDRVAVATAPPR